MVRLWNGPADMHLVMEVCISFCERKASIIIVGFFRLKTVELHENIPNNLNLAFFLSA